MLVLVVVVVKLHIVAANVGVAVAVVVVVAGVVGGVVVGDWGVITSRYQEMLCKRCLCASARGMCGIVMAVVWEICLKKCF